MNRKKKPRFLRRDTFKNSSIGKKRKKKQKWRRARGRHNKIRQKEKGYGKEPGVGYCAARKTRGFVGEMRPLLVTNIKEIEKATKENIIILSRTLGRKKKSEIIKKIREKNLNVLNAK